MRTSRTWPFALGAACAALIASSAANAAFRGPIFGPSAIAHVHGHAEDGKGKGKGKGDKAQKGEKGTKVKNSERSNASGEVRGQERTQEVQGMQDSGKGSQQRGQKPSK